MENEKNVENWRSVVKDYGIPGIKQLYGFYSFNYMSSGSNDNMPFVHILSVDGDIVKRTITSVYGINLNFLPLKTRIQYVEALKRVESGLFGMRRNFGEVYINELDLIHPALKRCLHRYRYSEMKNVLFIKNENVDFVIRKSIGAL